MIVATSTPTDNVANAALEIVGNGLPEHVVDGLSDGPHGAQRDERDQGTQQAVLQQVLTILGLV